MGRCAKMCPIFDSAWGILGGANVFKAKGLFYFGNMPPSFIALAFGKGEESKEMYWVPLVALRSTLNGQTLPYLLRFGADETVCVGLRFKIV